jgi:hypothetical protein
MVVLGKPRLGTTVSQVGVVVMREKYRPGDPVIFCMSKVSTEPGPRATDVHPAPNGETYNYLVPKFWRVESRHPNGLLVLITRRGKRHQVQPDDPRLRPAWFWERWLYGSRFPSITSSNEPAPPSRVLQDSVS